LRNQGFQSQKHKVPLDVYSGEIPIVAKAQEVNAKLVSLQREEEDALVAFLKRMRRSRETQSASRWRLNARN